jgi:hypothetical protein
VLHLGHGGLCCPANVTSATESEVAEAEEGDIVDEVLLEGWEPGDTRTLVIVDVSRVHQLSISWCLSGPLCAQTPPTGKVLSEDDYESSEWAVLIKL